MSTSLSILDFNVAIQRATDRTTDRLRRVVQRAALLCVGSIVDGNPAYSPGTPVRTGFARSGWYTTLSGPGAGGGGLADAATQGDPMAQAIEVLRNVQLGQTVWIVNHVPYIVRLEYGWSKKQAPNGMVRLTCAAGQEIAEQALALEPAA